MKQLTQHMIKRTLLSTVCGLMLIGCDRDNPSGSNGNNPAASLPDTLFLAVAPSDPIPIPKLKTTSKEGEEVVMRVVIGGRRRPFVDNRAIMTVVDGSMLNHCALPGDSCKTPWDYCCSSLELLKENMASVKIIDSKGRPLKVNFNDSPMLQPSATLVVQGTVAPHSNSQSFVVNASGIYVEAMH